MKAHRKVWLFLVMILSCISAIPVPAGAEPASPAVCTACNMSIEGQNKRFSVVDTKSTDKVAFDDIGCALLWRAEQCATKELQFNTNAEVFDFSTGEPVAIEAASFVVDSGVKTPMGYGIVAFKDRQSAERFVAETGKGSVVPYRTLSLPKGQ
ncbi:MAG: nitrous oxide reductase accessory protein NosL [Nitrospirota bacterium]